MKKVLKSLIVIILTFFARLVLHRYRPKIVMITGSVGKTSTKDAVAAVLAKRYFVRKSEKSFNTEFGVPFTILGVGNPWDDALAWFSVGKSALALLLLPNHYPNLLVLEVGADKPGDLAHILKYVTPDAVVVTRLPEISVHVEAYASPEAVREEEFSPAYALPAGSPLIISSDDQYAVASAARTAARIISYGVSEHADVRASDIAFNESNGKVDGMRAFIRTSDELGVCVVQGSVGEIQILPAAAAIAAAQAFQISLVEAFDALTGYEAPAGRGRLLVGKNGSIIIDDSYNASPVAVEEALKTLKTFPHAKRPYSAAAMKGRRIAVLGDMLELGRYSVMEHERIADFVGSSADVIVTIGIRARAFGTAAPGVEILQFNNSREAAVALTDFVREGDVVLVKGSQSVRMERIVEALLAHKEDSTRLVRQEKKWRERR